VNQPRAGHRGRGEQTRFVLPTPFAAYFFIAAIFLASVAASTGISVVCRTGPGKKASKGARQSPVQAGREGGAQGRPMGAKELSESAYSSSFSLARGFRQGVEADAGLLGRRYKTLTLAGAS